MSTARLLMNPYNCNEYYEYIKNDRKVVLIVHNTIAYLVQAFGEFNRTNIQIQDVPAVKARLKPALSQTFIYNK